MTHESYFDWLLESRGISNMKYHYLFEVLFEIPYYYLIAMDENRYYDALNLRNDYENTNGRMCTIFVDPDDVSYLEFLIGIIDRFDAFGAKMSHDDIMKMFITNLGLSSFNDDVITNTSPLPREVIDGIIYDKADTNMHRDYAYDGEGGGLFVVLDSSIDMQKSEVYKQLEEYIRANHLISTDI